MVREDSSEKGTLSAVFQVSILCNKPPQNLVAQTMTAIIFSRTYNLGRAWWGQCVSALASISWASLEARDWTHLKVSLSTCLVVAAGCCQGSRLGLSTGTPAGDLTMWLLVFFKVWWPGSQREPSKGEGGWKLYHLFSPSVSTYTESILQHFIHEKQVAKASPYSMGEALDSTF